MLENQRWLTPVVEVLWIWRSTVASRFNIGCSASCVLARRCLLAISCGDRSLFGPHSIAPRHASFSVLPGFPPIPAGGPAIRLARVVGVLTPASGESLYVGGAVRWRQRRVGVRRSDYRQLRRIHARAHGVRRARRGCLSLASKDHAQTGRERWRAGAGVRLRRVRRRRHGSPRHSRHGTVGGGRRHVVRRDGNQRERPSRVADSRRMVVARSVDRNGGCERRCRGGIVARSTWIVARTATNLADSALVKVRAPVAKVTVLPGSATLARGQSSTFSAELRDAGNHLIDDRTATWSSSDPAIATVSASGGVLAAKIGTATITASAEGKTATAAVTVVSPVDHIELTPGSLSFASIGQSGSLTSKIVARTGASIDGITVSFSTSNAAVATVNSSGSVVATGNGSATITASADGSTATAAVTVKQIVASIAVAPKAASVSAIGDSRTFTATVLDAIGAPIQAPNITWTSSDPTIATVSGGVAVAKRAGSATITASIDGKSDAATFIVAPTARLLLVLSDKSQIRVGESATISAALADNNGNIIGPATASFTVTPSGVAQLSGGTLTGLQPGTAHITAVAGPLTGTLDIRVTGTATEGLEVTPSTMERLPGGNGFFTVTGATSTVSWTVNGIVGGNATYGTIDVEGFYRAPASVPTPSTFDVCARTGVAPIARLCARHDSRDPERRSGSHRDQRLERDAKRRHRLRRQRGVLQEYRRVHAGRRPSVGNQGCVPVRTREPMRAEHLLTRLDHGAANRDHRRRHHRHHRRQFGCRRRHSWRCPRRLSHDADDRVLERRSEQSEKLRRRRRTHRVHRGEWQLLRSEHGRGELCFPSLVHTCPSRMHSSTAPTSMWTRRTFVRTRRLSA